ncbi:BnaA09g29360D [Brassica napus]|uniref:BnaA09g29360D protein n=1 Tax=Brassica napus TaxID=3708 RepID=A0A078FTM7_BRANA|nr:BnaA09g29360D [Brassica napus]
MGLVSLDVFASAEIGLEKQMQDCGGKRTELGFNSSTYEQILLKIDDPSLYHITVQKKSETSEENQKKKKSKIREGNQKKKSETI